MASLGNISAGSLVKSAASIQSTLAVYQDDIQAYQWSQSAQTAADYQTYSSYLSGRITTLQSSGTLSDASKALTLTKALSSAQSSYSSNEIQRASMAVIDGTGSTTDKYNTIAGLYDQAVASGDDNLAQNLEASANTLSQQIQYDAQTAATAQTALDKTNNAAIAAGDLSASSAIGSTIAELDNGIKANGAGQTTQLLKQATAALTPTLTAMGVTLPKGSTLNIGSLIQAAFQAQYHLYGLAGTATQVSDPTSSQTYAEDQQKIADGRTTLSVGGTSFTAAEAQSYANNPGMYYVGLGADNGYQLKQSVVEGYTYNTQGQVTPVYSPSGAYTTNAQQVSANSKQITSDLTKAGFTNVSVSSNGTITATPSNASGSLVSGYLKSNGISENTPVRIVQNAAGYQIEPSTSADGSQTLLVLSKDGSGNLGLYEQNFDTATQGSRLNLISSTGNFNVTANSATIANPNEGVGQAIALALKNYQTKGNGYTESTVIPEIAKQYFDGNTNAAATAVYQARKPLEQATTDTTKSAVNNQSTLQLNPLVPSKAGQLLGVPTLAAKVPTTTKTPTLPAPTVAKVIPTPVAPITAKTPTATVKPVSTPGLAGVPSLSSNTNPALSAALAQSFNGFNTQAKGYTESTILPEIAKQFYGGNIQAASTPVYQYRMANFNQ